MFRLSSAQSEGGAISEFDCSKLSAMIAY